MNPALIRILLLVLPLAAAAAWFSLRQAESIGSVKVTRGSIAEAVYATGAVEPVIWAKVQPLVRTRIVEHCRCEGRRVRKGDILARLDDSAPQAELRQVEARRLFVAAELSRQSDLFRRGITTKQAQERAESDLMQLDYQIDALKARLRDYLLLSPADGTVLRSDAQVGDIPATTDTLFTVGEPSPLHVVGEVNEEDIPRIALGQKVLLRSEGFPGRALASTLDAITPKGDAQAKTFRVYLALPADSPLSIGMNVEANIIVAEKAEALLVPSEAIREPGTPRAAVWRVENGRLRLVPLTTGIRGARNWEALGGVAAGDILAAPLKPHFSDGLAVRTP